MGTQFLAHPFQVAHLVVIVQLLVHHLAHLAQHRAEIHVRNGGHQPKQAQHDGNQNEVTPKNFLNARTPHLNDHPGVFTSQMGAVYLRNGCRRKRVFIENIEHILNALPYRRLDHLARKRGVKAKSLILQLRQLLGHFHTQDVRPQRHELPGFHPETAEAFEEAARALRNRSRAIMLYALCPHHRKTESGQLPNNLQRGKRPRAVDGDDLDWR